MKKFLIPIVYIVCFVSAAFCGEGNDNNYDGKLLIYKEQQMRYIDMILDVEKDNARLEIDSWELLGKSGKSSARYYNDRYTSIKNRKSDNNNRIKDLEFRKSELRLKVVGKDGFDPDWWVENERYLSKTRAEIQTKGLNDGLERAEREVNR